MKNIFKLFSLALIVLVASCTEPEDIITGNAKEGALLSLDESSVGALAGAPEAGVSLDSASISFQNTSLVYGVTVKAGVEKVNQIVVYKSFAGQDVEVTSVAASEGVSLELTTIAEFVAGFSGISEADLRIGDQIVFYSLMEMKDGRILRDKNADIAVSISCVADLTGTYLVTNSWCSPSFTVEITKNADGTYYLPRADGGALSLCTGNSTLMNYGNIQEQCGEILPSGDLQFGSANSGYDIGDIVSGSWDAVNGIITLKQGQSFTGNWPSEWTSTYTRQ